MGPKKRHNKKGTQLPNFAQGASSSAEGTIDGLMIDASAASSSSATSPIAAMVTHAPSTPQQLVQQSSGGREQSTRTPSQKKVVDVTLQASGGASSDLPSPKAQQQMKRQDQSKKNKQKAPADTTPQLETGDDSCVETEDYTVETEHYTVETGASGGYMMPSTPKPALTYPTTPMGGLSLGATLTPSPSARRTPSPSARRTPSPGAMPSPSTRETPISLVFAQKSLHLVYYQLSEACMSDETFNAKLEPNYGLEFVDFVRLIVGKIITNKLNSFGIEIQRGVCLTKLDAQKDFPWLEDILQSLPGKDVTLDVPLAIFKEGMTTSLTVKIESSVVNKEACQKKFDELEALLWKVMDLLGSSTGCVNKIYVFCPTLRLPRFLTKIESFFRASNALVLLDLPERKTAKFQSYMERCLTKYVSIYQEEKSNSSGSIDELEDEFFDASRK